MKLLKQFRRIFELADLGGPAVGIPAGGVVEPTVVRGRRLGCPLRLADDVRDGFRRCVGGGGSGGRGGRERGTRVSVFFLCSRLVDTHRAMVVVVGGTPPLKKSGRRFSWENSSSGSDLGLVSSAGACS